MRRVIVTIPPAMDDLLLSLQQRRFKRSQGDVIGEALSVYRIVVEAIESGGRVEVHHKGCPPVEFCLPDTQEPKEVKP